MVVSLSLVSLAVKRELSKEESVEDGPSWGNIQYNIIWKVEIRLQRIYIHYSRKSLFFICT